MSSDVLLGSVVLPIDKARAPACTSFDPHSAWGQVAAGPLLYDLPLQNKMLDSGGRSKHGKHGKAPHEASSWAPSLHTGGVVLGAGGAQGRSILPFVLNPARSLAHRLHGV